MLGARVLLFFLLALTEGTALGFEFCQENSNLYTPVIEFTKGSKHILFAGVIHGAPKGYYQRESSAIESWIQKQEGSTVILTEFFTCQTESQNIKSGTRLTAAQIQTLQAKGLDTRPLSGATQLETCPLDSDGKTKRPAYLVDRNKTECDARHGEGFDCQWADFKLPSGKKISVQSGDLEVDRQSPLIQMTASLAYRAGNDLSDPEFFKLFQSFMVGDRNKHLSQKITSTLQSSDNIVLPWGAGHLEGIQKLLESQGFKQTNADCVLYGGPESLGHWSWYNENFKKNLDQAAPRKELCAPAPASKTPAQASPKTGFD